MKRVVASLLIGALVLVVGCNRKKEGGPCADGEQICADKGHALVCKNQVFTTVSCGGALGCSKYGDKVACDTSFGSTGTACMGEDDEFACSQDKTEALLCSKKGQFDVWMECRGPNGCVMSGHTPNCDVSIARKGDPCKKPESFACSDDAKQMLICHSGKFDTYRYCRGGNGCAAKADGPACDESVSMTGDPCGLPGQLVCATDGKTELVCQGGAYVRSRSCKNSCVISSRPGRPIDCN